MKVLTGINRLTLGMLIPILLSTAPTALAEDCTLAIKTDGAIRCLERKIAKLEKLLEQSQKANVVMPKNAVLEFKAESCPAGWAELKALPAAAKLISEANSSVHCVKI